MRVLALVRRGRGLQTALALGDTCAVALCRPGDEGVLHAARAAGAARAVALWSDILADTDYLGLAQLAAATARHLGFDLVVTGTGDRGAVGPALADRLTLPHLTGVVDARIEGHRVIARRRAAGALRTYTAAPPALLCAIGAPLAEAPAGTSVERISLAQIGVSDAELAWRRRFALKPAPGPHPLPRAFPDAATLAARLAADGLLPRRR
jgi:electron transfer flavoprotein alpha/beta subunit